MSPWVYVSKLDKGFLKKFLPWFHTPCLTTLTPKLSKVKTKLEKGGTWPLSHTDLPPRKHM